MHVLIAGGLFGAAYSAMDFCMYWTCSALKKKKKSEEIHTFQTLSTVL